MSFKKLELYIDKPDTFLNYDETDSNTYTLDNLPDHYDFILVDFKFTTYKSIINAEQILKNGSVNPKGGYEYVLLNSRILIFMNVKILEYSMYRQCGGNIVTDLKNYNCCSVNEITIYPCILQSCSDLTQNEYYANMKLEPFQFINLRHAGAYIYIATKRETMTKKAVAK